MTDHDGMFIRVEVEASAAGDPELAAKLAEVCPVDIFASPEPDHAGASRASTPGGQAGSTPARVQIVDENLDECVLCELCINAAPAGTVRVVKLYSGESLPA